MLHRFIAVLLSLLPVSFAAASSVTGNFIQQRALDPFKLQTGLPSAASRLVSSSELQLSVVHNNVFMGGSTLNERLILDGESSQVNLRFRHRLNQCWQVNASASWLSHSGGWFDNPVDDWHQFFGLPDAMRGETPANQLEYSYENGTERRALTDESHGWGDSQLHLQRSIGCVDNAPILRFGLKLPIGAINEFRGNGRLDAFVDLQSSWQQRAPSSRWKWAASVGALTTSGDSGQVLEQEALVGFGVIGLNARLGPRIQLLSQLDWHTAMFKSDLRELSETAVQLSLGLRYLTHSRGTWEISFSEDAVIDTAPDIVVRLAWISRFD